MSGSRSKNGCWTCRLRRKKCDETHPICQTCAFRNVACHGYGPQPAWMDGGDREEIELAKTKRVVGQSYRARRMARWNHHPAVSITGNITGRSDRDMGKSDNSTLAAGPVALQTRRLPSHLSAFQKVQSSDSTVWLPGPRDISHDQEVSKIAYFFDHVFPTQHPFLGGSPSSAAPSLEQRWLRTLLLETVHFHLSALAIGALHQSVAIERRDTGMENGNGNGNGAVLELLEYHSLTVRALQDQLGSLNTLTGPTLLKVELGLLASMIQLVSFEVIRESKPFKGDIGNWEIHLDGAGALLDMMYSSSNIPVVEETVLDVPIKSSHSESAWRSDSFWMADGKHPGPEMIGLEFLTAVYVWTDVCRCASMGWHYRTNQASYPYKQYIDEGRIQLSSVMGCSNWAISCIMDISHLEAWKNQGLLDGFYTAAEGDLRGAVIQERLIGELRKLRPISNVLTLDERDKILITWAYSICALIYLHIVISDDAGPGNPAIQDYVKCIINVMKAMSPSRLRSVSWPFCVAGCMAATGKERNAFRQIFQLATSNGTNTTTAGTIWSGFAVVEECWRQRFMSKDWCEKKVVMCWRQAMDSLGARILLI